MKFERRYSVAGKSAEDQVAWRIATVPSGTVEVPEAWSDNAARIIHDKYLRKAGVPVRLQAIGSVGVPEFLWPCAATSVNADRGPETSARQVFHRMAGCWTYWGWRGGYFDGEEDARAFYDEIYLMLARQVAAPNSPQWFNTGLHWAYGIEGEGGQWVDDGDGPRTVENSYERPQVHACFINSIADNLVDEGGIADLLSREARIFKFGSGAGSNFSKLRSKDERLSGGGVASGLISFLEVFDRNAGSIQSGGTTRRAAKMVVLDADHPEVVEFVGWKVREEAKAAALAVGSRVLRERAATVAETTASLSEDPLRYALASMEAISDARAAGVPEAVIDRARVGIVPDELPIDWEGEAIRTISAQNANNSIRVMNRFMELSARDPSTLNWDLTARTTGEVVRSVNAKGLWDSVCRAAWASGDPGLQFGNTINEWNTCRADGEILSSNPCGEYQWLDDTACNLASLRLTAFLLPVGSLDLDAYEHALRIWTVILDISNSMGSFPGRSIAETNIKYRTIGLGYADLGGLLMRLAIPYDSDEGRALAAGLTALMTGVAYRTSAEMAADPRLGPFPRWGTNAEGMWRVLRNHARACGAGRPDISIGYEGLTVRPYEVARDGSELWERARNAWEDVQRSASGFRNAQVSLLAPTGTISFVMDCDTTGVEPDLGLVKRKRLAGGGEDMTIVNRAVPEALRRLGYDERAIEKIVSFVEAEGYLPQLVDSVRSFTGYVDPVHEAVFDCAFPAREGGRSIAPMGHVRMVAAVQPFLSGAVSKTIGLPADATVEDVSRALREAHRFGLKAVAVYRDGSKLTQPLSVGAGAPKLNGEWSRPAADEETLRMYSNGHDTSLPRGVREYLPWRREGRTQKVKIGDHGQSVFMTMNHYPDGRLGEVYFELGHEGSTLRGMAGLFAMAVSVGLQYGVPVREFVDRFTGTKFEPAGIVEGHNRIKIVSSIGDLVGRELGITFLGEERLANTPAPQTEFVVGQGIIGMEHAALKEARSSLTGRTCPRCGALARTTGTCVNCEVCDYEEGCG